MARKELSVVKTEKRDKDRQMQVYKRDDMIQKGRHNLTVQEQRCVLYAISQIQPTDDIYKAYSLELGEFYDLCGLQNESYTKLKAIMKGLSDRSWWITIDDDGTESLVRWFSTLKFSEKSGRVTIKFHEDMMPYLLELSKQNAFYTRYQLKYILPMSGQYSIRLYELLKSYQKNNIRWYFEINELKRLLYCEQYVNFFDFKRRVLEPATEEINKYTDIKISWEPIKDGRKVTHIDFKMLDKDKAELLATDMAISCELDG